MSTTISNEGCANGFEKKGINKTLKDGEAAQHCFKNDVTWLKYKIDVQPITDNNETAKLLVVIIERVQIRDNLVPERLDDIKHHSICTDASTCENKVDVSSRKKYAILVINDDYTDLNFTKASDREVTYEIDFSGTSHSF